MKKNFWEKKVDNNFFSAPIDTTFALYRPYSFGGYWLKSLRSDEPYLARHLTWYDDKDLNEDVFYNKNINRKSSFYSNKRFLNY